MQKRILHPPLIILIVWLCAGNVGSTNAQTDAQPNSNTAAKWETIEAVGEPTARHEAALVAFKDKIYLIGGRRINPVDVFDPSKNTWTEKSLTPLELHHFQAVVVGDAIYLIGAMTGPWPRETPLEKIIVYYPDEDRFEFGHTIPEERRRGGAGAVFHNGKIYIVGGITNGHQNGYQPWLDEYDPATGDWEILDDAPHARDHFQAVVVNNKLIAAAGRTTSQITNEGFDLTVKPIDVYDLASRKWLPESEAPQLPTLRAGNMAMNFGNHLVIGGGESGEQKVAHNEVEAFDMKTKTWSTWPSLRRGRHGSGFAIVGEYVYTASGSGNRGGGPELKSIERFKLPTDTSRQPAESSTDVSEFRQWHKVELAFEGPQTSEDAAINPFTDYRLQVTFRHEKSQHVVRGFYSADGNPAETSAKSGNVWKVRFSPDQIGKWTYSATLRSGEQIATNDDANAGDLIALPNAEGAFHVAANTKLSRDFRTQGKLTVSNGYFRFGDNGRYWLKGGTNSPENLLAYVDFDDTFRMKAEAREGESAATSPIHSFAPHIDDWAEGDPTWQDGKGKGIIGSMNYLASRKMNAAYFLTLNINGDGNDVWPYSSPDDFSRFDCSKLDQWEIVFNHMQRKGILLHMVTQETENERLLDDGDTGPQRKLYYRELIARFAHHPALVWDLGEENGPAEFSPNGQTAVQQKAMASYIKQHDPYKHPVLIHTHSTAEGKEHVQTPLLGHAPLDGLSFQVNHPNRVHNELIEWKHKAKAAKHDWLITMDEIGLWHTGAAPDADDPTRDNLRRHVLWGTLMAGGAGVEWYFGAKLPHNDLNSEDWRQRESIWKQTAVALQFFEQHLPYWKMKPMDALTKSPDHMCFAAPGEVYVIYVPKDSGQPAINMKGTTGRLSVQWFDPVAGGRLETKTMTHVASQTLIGLGSPPTTDSDWVVLLKR